MYFNKVIPEAEITELIKPQLQKIKDYDGDNIIKMMMSVLEECFTYRGELVEIPIHIVGARREEYINSIEMQMTSIIYKTVIVDLMDKNKPGEFQKAFMEIMRLGKKRGWNLVALSRITLECIGIVSPVNSLALGYEDLELMDLDYN